MDSQPFISFHFFIHFVHHELRWTIFMDFSLFSNNIRYLFPSSRLLFRQDNQGFTLFIGSCCSSCSMNVCITIYWYTILDNICYLEIKSSSCNICRNKNVSFWLFKFLKFKKSLLLKHMRMKQDRFISSRFDKILNSFWSFNGVAKNNRLRFGLKLLEITKHNRYFR